MASEFGQKIEDMSIEEINASLDRLIKANRSDNDPETRQYREDEITRLTEELHRRQFHK